MNSLPIRLLTGQDGPEYQRLRLKALQTDPEVFLATFDQESQKREQSFAQELELAYHPPTFGYYGLFLEDETLAGYLQISPSYLPKQAHLAFLYNLYVDPTTRGQDVASRLWQHATTQLQQHTPSIERVFLSCVATNKPAISFYKKCGFKRCGIRPASIKWQGRYLDEVEMVCLIN
jgi:ribosomal protein S18 acetylase RimI-like enzyme